MFKNSDMINIIFSISKNSISSLNILEFFKEYHSIIFNYKIFNKFFYLDN